MRSKGRFGEAMRAAAFAAGLAGSPESAAAQKQPTWESTVGEYAKFMRVGGEARAPDDFVLFCERHPEECQPFPGRESERMRRDEGGEFRRLELSDTNTEVNSLPQVSDLQQFGRTEYWTIAGKGGGDCEDLANLKKRMLRELRGFSPSTLLLAHVRTETGEDHVVLVVRMRDGDYVMDNRLPGVMIWSDLVRTHGYTFISRQSYLDPMVWRTIQQPK